jgi:hypothetical protein
MNGNIYEILSQKRSFTYTYSQKDTLNPNHSNLKHFLI